MKKQIKNVKVSTIFPLIDCNNHIKIYDYDTNTVVCDTYTPHTNYYHMENDKKQIIDNYYVSCIGSNDADYVLVLVGKEKAY